MNKLYMSKPIMITAIGNNTEETMKALLEGNQEGFIRNRNNILVGRAKLSGEDLYDSILDSSIEQIKDDVLKVIGKVGKDKIGIAIGGCDYHSDAATKAHGDFLKNESFGDYCVDLQNPYRPIEKMKEAFDITGPCFAIASACSSGNVAVIRAIDLILSGSVDAMIVGGIDHASDLISSGFDSLSAISENKTNPFSKNREGITLGDGSALFILSKEKIFDFPVAVSGWGESSDGYNMTSPDPEGVSVKKIYIDALPMANKKSSDINYINLHGTGTAVNDEMEAKAVNAIFGDTIPCSSTKAMTGHTLGSAGAVGTAICAMTIASSQPALLPPHCYDGEYDDSLPKINLTKVGDKETVNCAMSDAFAFGGSNAVVILERV